ncbi:RNA-binding protein [Candidatus Lokiarchaeum ossiferum]|uniref:RNA-binding protein n=1 Tax=Candidatus Lokiarchaeum ossiferum TaxID=2951803 RepID=A0ABY6HSQ1_9ARCH|nr:RNA-binding protein [Candidatus Lokiarchaeum sp. B-35]
MPANEQSGIPKFKIRQIDIRTHAHATESIDKVKKLVQNLFSFDLTENEFIIEHCSGQYGQRISSLLVRLKIQKLIKQALEDLAHHLSIIEKEKLASEFHSRLDEKFKFYFRLDKQNSAMGHICLGNKSETIQVIIMIQNKTPNIPISVEAARDYYKQLHLIE